MSENITVPKQSLLIQGWHHTTSHTFHFTDSSRVFCIYFSLLCPKQRDHGILIASMIRALFMYTTSVLKNSKFYWDTIIYVYQYLQLFIMNNSITDCSQSKKKITVIEKIIKK